MGASMQRPFSIKSIPRTLLALAVSYLTLIGWTNSQLITPDTVQQFSHIYQFASHAGDIERVATALRAIANFNGSSLIDHLMQSASQKPCSVILNGWLGLYKLSNKQCQEDVGQFVCGFQTLLKGIAAQCPPDNMTCLALKGQAMTAYNWTAYVVDATSGANSGLLEGNRLWLGTYRECHAVTTHLPTKGPYYDPKYCTVQFSTGASKAKVYSNVCYQSMGGPSIGPEEPGCSQQDQLVKTVFGICPPKSCSEEDILYMAGRIKGIASKYLDICLEEDSVTCEERPVLAADWRAILMICLLSVLALFLVIGSVYDLYFIEDLKMKVTQGKVIVPGSLSVALNNAPREVNGDACTSILSLGTAVKMTEKDYYDQLGVGYKMALAFSVQRNTRKLLTTKTAASDVSCIHGLRVLTNAWVILAHSYYLLVPYMGNMAALLRLPRDFGFQFVDNSTMSADTFFVISGFLVSFLWFKEIGFSKGQKLQSPTFWLWLYAHRLLRIVPIYMLILGASMLIPYTAQGPLWRTDNGSSFDIQNCKENWWTNLLFINNFVSLDNACMPWTWYMANEMQFYLFAPIFLILLWFFPWIGLGACLVMIGGCSLLRGIFISNEVYPPTLMFSLNPIFKETVVEFYKDIYLKPYMRCAPYVVGLMLGYWLYRTKNGIRLPKVLVIVIWCLSTLICCAVIFAPYGFAVGVGRISIPALGFYGGIHRWVWGVGISLIIFLCAQGFGGAVNYILSWKPWAPLGRMSYVAYLIHPFVIGIFYMQTHRGFHIDYWMMFYYFVGNIMITYLAAFVLCTCVELPVKEICNIFIKSQREADVKHTLPVTEEPFPCSYNLTQSTDIVKERPPSEELPPN